MSIYALTNSEQCSRNNVSKADVFKTVIELNQLKSGVMGVLTKLRPTAIAATDPIYSQTNENTHHRHNCRAIPRTLDSRLATSNSRLCLPQLFLYSNNLLYFNGIVVFSVIIDNNPIETHKAFTNINTQGFITHENSY